MAVSNKSEGQSVLQLLRDVEEAFQEFVKNIKKECDPNVAATELSGTLQAVQEILQSVGKALQTARAALRGKAACGVEDVSSVYLNSAQSIRTALNIEEPNEGQKKGRYAKNKAYDDLLEGNKPGKNKLEKYKPQVKVEMDKLKERAEEYKSEEEDEDEEEEEEEDKAKEKIEDKPARNDQEGTQQQENLKGMKEQKDIKKKKPKKREECKSLNLLELLSLFYDVEKTYSEQVRKLDKILKNDTDPAELEIRKTMKNVLKKTKKIARKSRNKTLSS